MGILAPFLQPSETLMTAITPGQMFKHFSGLPLIRQTLTRLENELSAELVYHSVSHTRDVFEMAMVVGVSDSLSYHQLYLLALASVFHDIGFIVQPSSNEPVCARMAREALASLPELGAQDLKLVETMILDTALQSTSAGPKQLATSLLSGYLLDADLSNFGRTDFLSMSELVRREGRIEDKKAFYQGTLSLFDAHSWNTKAANSLLQEQKVKNRVELFTLIDQL